MKKQILSIALLLSLVPSLHAAQDTDRHLVPATDARISQAIVDHKDQLLIKYIQSLQENRDQKSENHQLKADIEQLKATIDERAAQIAGNKIVGWSIGSAFVTGIATFILSNMQRPSHGSSRF